MTRKFWFTGAACLAIAIASLGVSSARADGLRCKERLVSNGDPQYVVEQRCGPPDAVAQRTERRKVVRYISVPCGNSFCSQGVEDTIDVLVEEWTYDFGRNRFLQFVQFVNGRVDRVVSGGYGYKDP